MEKHGAKAVKICATAGVLSFEGPVGAQQYSFEELKEAADEAHRHGLKIAAHAHGTEGIIAASQAGIDSIEHDSMMTEEAAAVIRKNGTWVAPNMYLVQAIDMDALPPPIRAKATYVLPLAIESFKLASEMNLKIANGSDAGVYPHGENAKELTARVSHGMSALAAIRSATKPDCGLGRILRRPPAEHGRTLRPPGRHLVSHVEPRPPRALRPHGDLDRKPDGGLGLLRRALRSRDRHVDPDVDRRLSSAGA